MSVINKMLQDLDARGSAPGEAMQPNIRPVAANDSKPGMAVVGGAVALLLLAGAGAGLWWMMKKPAPAPVAAPLVATVTNVARSAAPVAAPEPAIAQPVDDAAPEATPELISEATSEATPEAAPEPAPKAARKVVVAPQARPQPTVRVAAPPQPAAEPTGRHMTAQQRAETEYRRALAGLQEGRVHESVAALERALAIDPRHDSARQTLVGLLVESGRSEEALRVLGSGLALDPRQPAMAMLLARLQIERGASGIDTLMRTLPYAAGNAEYHAFLAGALARAGRNREAVEQYQAALRAAPGNGVWWMGLGISLEAEKNNAAAVAAFERARDLPNLSPQLRAFVDRKLQLLSQ